MKLALHVNQILGENHQLLNILIIDHAFFKYLFYGYVCNDKWIW